MNPRRPQRHENTAMKPGLSLRMSQHLALTPQLQQSIRLLQLSTLELSQEVDQMLDENPFLERSEDEAPTEAFGLEQSDTYVSLGDRVSESASTSSSSDDSATEVRDEAVTDVAESWDGDGSVDMRPDDSEWGGDAGPRQNNGEETADAIDLARSSGSLTDFLHRQALSLRLSEIDRAALRFLIESLNDDGYLTDTLPELAASLTGSDDDEQLDELVHRFTVALSLLQSLEPVGVGARDLAECLRIQIKALLKEDPGRRHGPSGFGHLRSAARDAGQTRLQTLGRGLRAGRVLGQSRDPVHCAARAQTRSAPLCRPSKTSSFPMCW